MARNDYNPDVLNCLANLSSDEIFTPPQLANRMLDLLPQELFANPATRFLDPCCKSGVFLREIVKRLDRGLQPVIADRRERIEHIVQRQVFGIAITELTALMSRRSVYCSKYADSPYSIHQFGTREGNIQYQPLHHTWQGGKCVYCGASQGVYDRGEAAEQHAYQFIHTNNPEKIFNMKFDVIIGNPPYQLDDGGQGASAPPIYHLFIKKALQLTPRYLCMIIPSRWMSGGRGLDEFRISMLNDKRIRILHDFPNSEDCFSGVDIKGGICYFLWEQGSSGDCLVVTHHNDKAIESRRPLLEKGYETFIRFNEQISIIKKIKKHGERSFSEYLQAGRFFGFHTKVKWDDDNMGWIQTADGKDFIRIQKTKDKSYNVKVYAHGGHFYIKHDDVPRNRDYIASRKIIIPEAGNPDSTILGRPRIAEPNSCSTNTFIVAISPNKSFTEDEASNILTYLRTKTLRFLVATRTTTQHMPPQSYQFVPMQDFSHPWTDEMLYEKYGLTEEEIAFIESMVRPMD